MPKLQIAVIIHPIRTHSTPNKTGLAGPVVSKEADMSHGWHRADIRAAVEKRGKTLTQLALDNGLAPAACRNALCRRHVQAEKAIAAFIDVAPWELWPDRWLRSEDGKAARIDNRLKRRISYLKHHKPRAVTGHRQKSEAA